MQKCLHGSRRSGGGASPAGACQLLYEYLDRALQLLDARLLDALETDHAIDPGVDLPVAAAIAAVEFRDQMGAFAA